MLVEPATLELPPPGPELDARLRELPDSPAVFLLTAASGSPYLSKTAVLGRRVRRLLQATERVRSALNLRGIVERLEYWPSASRLASALQFYTLARRHYPDSYLKLCNLRMPSYVRLLLSNPFPRTQVTSRPGGRALAFGPFRTRAAAEFFENATLELFQIRRCQDDLDPSPDHPGCIYGEMGQCLRPCQQVVGPSEYATEVERVTEFLRTGGRSLSDTVERMRDRFSAELEFEEAARQHKRIEKIQQIWRMKDDLAMESSALSGIGVVPSLAPRAVDLFVMAGGAWSRPVVFSPDATADKPVSLDRRLREVLENTQPFAHTSAERQEHVALLARWYYSSWRDGEWLPFKNTSDVSYRKLVNIVHRISGV